MKFALESQGLGHRVRGYEPGRILIDGGAVHSSVVISAGHLDAQWEPQSVDDLAAQHVSALLRHRPEVVIFGTGRRQVFPDLRLFVALMDAGVGYEVMDTAAACRTYNVLSSEGRRVLAALFP